MGKLENSVNLATYDRHVNHAKTSTRNQMACSRWTRHKLFQPCNMRTIVFASAMDPGEVGLETRRPDLPLIIVVFLKVMLFLFAKRQGQ